MEWQDEGVLLSMRRHGESAAIIEVFTVAHGRHAGVVRGGGSRRMAPLLQTGAQVQVTWRARLDDHLGVYTVEPLRSRAAVLSDRLGLAGLTAVCAMVQVALPERAPQQHLWLATMALLDQIETRPDWPGAYLRWEMRLLEDMGFGLDLAQCAVTGGRDDLAFVSPRTGRAVSRAGAGEWASRLFPLPPPLMGQGAASPRDMAEGLAITGHFLTRAVSQVAGGFVLPAARGRLVDLLSRPDRVDAPG